jgi:polar amino acid transport system substrate-binding protein
MQRSVENGQLDGFVTYPSQDRQSYAHFSETPVSHIDFGYLVYRADHPPSPKYSKGSSLA